MRAVSVSVFFLVLAAVLLPAAEARPTRGGGNIAASGHADAEAAFKRQAGQAPAPTGERPAILGSYVWGGRADEEYRPFFQWELRLQAGTKALAGLRARTVTLNPDRSPAATGAWKTLPALASGARGDIALRQNCPAFASYQVDMEWEGGSASWVAADKTTLPVCLDDLGQQPYLVATAYMHDPDQKKKPWVATWWLWNLGGVAATDTVQTVSLYDQGQKVLKTVDVKTGVVKPRSAQECRATLPQPPPGYQTIGVSARCADVTISAEPAGFTGAKDVEVADVRIDGAQLRARVRNGFDRTLTGVVVTITLLDANGKKVRAVEMPAVDLAPGAQTDLAAAHNGLKGFAGFEIGWAVATPAPSAAAADDDEGTPMTVRGLEFRQKPAVRDQGKLWLKGTLTNRTGKPLTGLSVTFRTKGGGRAAELVFNQESLADGDRAAVALEAAGLERLEAIELVWTAK